MKQETVLIYAQNPNFEFTETGHRYIGKWIIFLTEKTWENWWSIIKKATEKGELGISAKYLYDPNFIGNKANRGVICVYTKDYRDKGEVFKVRNKLKELGFVQPLAYKTDEATLQGKYSYNTSNISLYRS